MHRLNRSILIILFTFFATYATAAEITYGDVKVSKLLRVYDGDTVFVDIAKFPAIIGSNISVRIAGIDAPEIRGSCLEETLQALNVKVTLERYLRSAKKIQLKNIRREKYFRILADVYADGENVATFLLLQNLVVPYDGGTKTKNWCK